MVNSILKNFIYLLLFIVIALQVSCNAPHSNPLDPENPNRHFFQIEGYVYSFSLPRTVLQNALIVWTAENKASLTNSKGYFKIEISEKKDGWLKVMLDGYRPDSTYITWNSTKLFKEFFLNQIPKLDSIEFYSILINHYPKIQNITLNARTKIYDKDNDIDSAFIQNKAMGVKLPLIYNVQTKFYENKFSDYDFGVDNLSEIIGIKFDFLVKDINGYEYLIGSEKLNRIIKDELTLESPINYDSTSSKPVLIWRRFAPGFKFTYDVEIYNDEFPPAIVWSKKNLNMDSISVFVDTDLPSGNYFWVLWCVDQFLNRARSRPASFRVK